MLLYHIQTVAVIRMVTPKEVFMTKKMSYESVLLICLSCKTSSENLTFVLFDSFLHSSSNGLKTTSHFPLKTYNKISRAETNIPTIWIFVCMLASGYHYFFLVNITTYLGLSNLQQELGPELTRCRLESVLARFGSISMHL